MLKISLPASFLLLMIQNVVLDIHFRPICDFNFPVIEERCDQGYFDLCYWFTFRIQEVHFIPDTKKLFFKFIQLVSLNVLDNQGVVNAESFIVNIECSLTQLYKSFPFYKLH
jgi:hypothetical protein